MFTHARNIGTIFDTTMSMLSHVSNVCKSAFYHLRTISRIRKYLSTQTTEILIHAFITSKLDHCNWLFYIMSLKTSLKSFNRYRMQLPDCSHPWSHHSHPPPSLLATCFWTNEIQDSSTYLQSSASAISNPHSRPYHPLLTF